MACEFSIHGNNWRVMENFPDLATARRGDQLAEATLRTPAVVPLPRNRVRGPRPPHGRR